MKEELLTSVSHSQKLPVKRMRDIVESIIEEASNTPDTEDDNEVADEQPHENPQESTTVLIEESDTEESESEEKFVIPHGNLGRASIL